MKQGHRVLIIDDETAIRRFLRVSLGNQGYIVFEAENGKKGISEAATHRPEVIILDLGLPDISGLEVLKAIREWSQTPVLILTVQDDEDEKVQLLDSGADDYLTKPFSVPELLARLRVILRHKQPQQDQPVFKFGRLEIDFIARSVKINKQLVKLTVTEYDLLRVLVKNAGKVVTQRQLLNEIWGPNAVEHSHYLRVYIGHLRKKIEEDVSKPRLILTEPGIGYRFQSFDD